ncbi:dihydroneopterin aldolase [Afifella sp. YEN Y35]|uniref:dihydroneopterin aldolase n=1 Tax=Afifella sp. YEN Y35 TaxID=3388337 RepID=UPI0039DFAAFE
MLAKAEDMLRLAAQEGADLVFVSEFVLPVRIGAYQRERHGPQQVRFDMTVATQPRAAPPAGEPVKLEDVLSYDALTDAIETIVAEGHFDLVETLAEKIAARILEEPLAAIVALRVEKLELEKARAGTTIIRRKEALGA